jgi:hypothetical protein
MKKLSLLLCYLLLYSIPTEAQWTIETDFSSHIHDLKVFDGQLYIGGNFTRRYSSYCYWSASYDGNDFTDQPTSIGGSGIEELDVFAGELYATGSMQTIGSLRPGIYKWTGTTWIGAGFINNTPKAIFADGNDLYVGNKGGEIYKKTGTGSFLPLPSLDNSSDDILVMTKYNGALIIGGSLDAYNSTSLNNIARFDGTDWLPLGTGLSGGMFGGKVICMAVYQNELYVGGSFVNAGGQSSKFIAKWDGTNWSDVGGSMTGAGYNGVEDMVVHDNKLFIVGDFDEMGGVASNLVSMWDGTTWHDLTLPFSGGIGTCIEVFNNKLYASTWDFNQSHLHSMDLSTVSIHNIDKNKIDFNIYPNPSTGILNIELQEEVEGVLVDLINTLGKVVFSQAVNFDSNIQIDVQNQPLGIYYIKIRAGDKVGLKKIVLR